MTDYPNGTLWKDSSSYKQEDEKYDFYGMYKNSWTFLGRFRNFLEVEWGAIEMSAMSQSINLLG